MRFDSRRVNGLRANQIRHRHFAAHPVLTRHHGGFGNRRVLLQKLLDLSGINVEAARNNQIAFAPAQRVISVFDTVAISPVRNQPSTKAVRVASSRRQ